MYEACPAANDVTVTTKDGKSFTVNGVVQEQVNQLTQQAIAGGIVGDQVGSAIGGLLNKKKSTPAPTLAPASQSDTCSHG